MKRIIILSLLALASCVNWGQAENQKCVEMGYKTGTALYLQCRNSLAQQRLMHAQIQANIGNYLMNRAAPPRIQRPINCRSYTVGRVTRMQCF